MTMVAGAKGDGCRLGPMRRKLHKGHKIHTGRDSKYIGALQGLITGNAKAVVCTSGCISKGGRCGRWRTMCAGESAHRCPTSAKKPGPSNCSDAKQTVVVGDGKMFEL